jgi:hypothetical protein
LLARLSLYGQRKEGGAICDRTCMDKVAEYLAGLGLIRMNK